MSEGTFQSRASARRDSSASSPRAEPASTPSRIALRRMAAPPLIQPDLEVNRPGDLWEREADAVAERVTGEGDGEAAPGSSPLSPASGIQRMANDDECIECAQNPHGIQRQADGGGTPTPSPSVAAYIRAPGPGMGLSPGLRRRIELHVGVDLGEVRVHSGPAAAQAAASLQARAFTHGRDIFLRRSEYSRDLRLMAHEATHVAQQTTGISRGIQRQVEEEPSQETTAPAAVQPASQALPGAPSMPVTPPLALEPAPPPAQAAGPAATVAPAAAAQPAPAPAALPIPAGPASAAPGVEPLMPEPALTLSDQEQERVERAERRAAVNAAAQEALPPAESQVGEAREAVTEPDVETKGRAEAELTQALAARAEPSPEIEQLCDDIRRVIREKRPPDEESLVKADPSAMAQEAGQQLNASVEGDAQRVKGSYDPLQEPPPGEKVQEGDELAGQPEAEAAPNIAAESAISDPVPAEEVSLDADVAASQARLDEAGMNSEPAKLIESGPVAEARAAQGELEQTAASEPVEALAAQQAALASAGQEMAALQEQALAALAASRGRTVRGVDDRQHKMVGSEEQMRADASARARAIFTEAQSQVDAQLRDLPRKAMDKWKAGVALLSTQFEQRLHKVEGWIKDRHSGGWGTVVQIWDEVTGYPDWVSEEYDIAEREFGDGVCALIREISSDVNTVIAACEGIIASANERIAAIFAQLPESLQTWAAQEQAGFQEQLQGLSRRVAKTQADFTRDLAQQAAQTVQDARAKIHALHQKAKGLLGRIADAIARFVEDPVKFIIEGLLELVGIPPASFWALVNRIRSVVSDIANDPAKFINNLVAALRAGFERFFENFPTHLLRGLFDWLFSGLGSVGVSLPADFSPKSLITFFLELMGITWSRIRALLAKHIGERNVAWIEQAWGLLSVLIQKGPQGIFEMIKDALNPSMILDMIIETAIEMLQSALIKQVAVRVLALFNPVGAIVQAIELIYKVLKWVFENAARIFSLVETIVNGIADILAGNIGGMAAAVERALGGLVPVVLDFLAGLLGVGDLPDKIAAKVKRLQGWVERLIDRVLGFLAAKAKSLMKVLGLGGEETTAEPEDESGAGATYVFTAAGQKHTLYVQAEADGDLEVMVASDREKVLALLQSMEDRLKDPEDDAGRLPDEMKKKAARLIRAAREHVTGIAGQKGTVASQNPSVRDLINAKAQTLGALLRELFEIMSVRGTDSPPPGSPAEMLDESIWEEVILGLALPKTKLSQSSYDYNLKVLSTLLERCQPRRNTRRLSKRAFERAKIAAGREMRARLAKAMEVETGDQIYYQLRQAAKAVNDLYKDPVVGMAPPSIEIHHQEGVAEHPMTFIRTRVSRLYNAMSAQIRNGIDPNSRHAPALTAIAAMPNANDRKVAVKEYVAQLIDQEITHAGPDVLEEIDMIALTKLAHRESPGAVHGWKARAWEPKYEQRLAEVERIAAYPVNRDQEEEYDGE